ncbi:hippocalcin-like protein 1 [Stylonychia lemnae]|uniref:Hippocalcin-like protein 1 n=1 Tax=Stylonychia lemnae TaxID=5949 RepID=A0A078AE41_STYLE|nr:hippocalcin-like protein 1 [Stylonychia lemnae]|eukprot:CDW80465.1 hippocalcin-like protein 1 [Stylonychia lemnae]
MEEDPNLTLVCGYNEFDPFIKFGRDNLLFVKREYLDKGFLQALFNIENHPFAEDFFLFFDTNRDGLIDFYEVVMGLDSVEKGDFEQKCKFCFAMYDILENGVLDIFTLREVLKKSYVNQIIQLESAISKLSTHKTINHDGWTFDEFEQEVFPFLEKSLSLALDRMEFHKQLINELEFRFNFTLESLEHLWNMYRSTIDKNVSENRLKTAVAFAAHSPELVTKEQFKLIMLDVFKVKDAHLVNNIFVIADTDGNGALDIRELIGNMVFWLRGTLGYKFALFFEVFVSVNGGVFVSKENLIKVIGDALKVFKESFFLAKSTADRMNTTLNGLITYEEFNNYCKSNPQAIDFLCRLTIGPYPLSDELSQRMIEFQKAKMIEYYPQLQLQQDPNQQAIIDNQRTASRQNLSKSFIESSSNNNLNSNQQQFMTPNKKLLPLMPPPQYSGNNYQIVPLEDNKKNRLNSQQGRLNFAGMGQQQMFNHIRSNAAELSRIGQTPVNPNKRWIVRD